MALVGLLAIIALTVYTVWARGPVRATLTVYLFALLFGPEGAYLKFPLMCPIDKGALAGILLVVVALTKWKRRVKQSGIYQRTDVFVFLGLFTAVATAMTNTDPLSYGSWIRTDLPGMTIKDGLSNGLYQLFGVGVPFLLGRWLFRRREDLNDLIHFVVLAGLLQVPFILLELRLSPFVHEFVYGYAAHMDWLQVLRWGGYRPMGFMAHGLALGLFMCVAVLGAAMLKRGKEKAGGKYNYTYTFYGLFVILVLCKSTAAIIYGMIAAPLLLRAKPKTLVRVSVGLALFVAIYPVMRATGVFPVDTAMDLANALSPERAESLLFRFENEELLIEKTSERPWFGWGTYGRSSIWDAELGKEASVADGFWIVIMSGSGASGLLGVFGLLLTPIFTLRRRLALFPDATARYKIAGLCFILAVCCTDLIPNGLFSNYPYLIAGALTGFQHELKRRKGVW